MQWCCLSLCRFPPHQFFRLSQYLAQPNREPGPCYTCRCQSDTPHATSKQTKGGIQVFDSSAAHGPDGVNFTNGGGTVWKYTVSDALNAPSNLQVRDRQETRARGRGSTTSGACITLSADSVPSRMHRSTTGATACRHLSLFGEFVCVQAVHEASQIDAELLPNGCSFRTNPSPYDPPPPTRLLCRARRPRRTRRARSRHCS